MKIRTVPAPLKVLWNQEDENIAVALDTKLGFLIHGASVHTNSTEKLKIGLRHRENQCSRG